MELVQIVSKNELLSNNWGIYKLSEKESIKYGGEFALTQEIFSDYALKRHDADELLSELKEYKYEGFFETQREAYLQVKLVEMETKIQRLEQVINSIEEVLHIKTPTW